MQQIISYIGASMFVLGGLAIVLDFMNKVPKLLVWIYNWGDGTAWVIKIGFLIVGAALYLLSSRFGSDEEATMENEID